MASPLISVIMPARNAAATVREAIASLQAQTWADWELLFVDNGSSDGTAEIVRAFGDDRIRVLHEPEPGVSRARNRGLDAMRGELFCFFDADDRLPPNSLEARARILLASPEVMFADGRVLRWDHATGALAPLYAPSFRGRPREPLLRLSDSVFFGPTWMVRRTPATDLRLPTHMRHAEDLAFYLSIAHAGAYDHTPEVVLHYRKGHGSAMSDLDGLWKGYQDLYRWAAALPHPPDAAQLAHLWARAKRVMSRSFIRHGRLLAGLKAWASPPPRTGPVQRP